MCNILHTLSKPAAERNQSRAVAQIKDGGCAWRAFLDVGQGFRSWGLSRPWGCHSGPSQRFEERGQRRPRAFKFRLERRQVTSVPTESQLPAVASRPGSSRRNLQPSTRGPRRPAHVDPARTARYTRLVSGSGLVRRPRPSPRGRHGTVGARRPFVPAGRRGGSGCGLPLCALASRRRVGA
jgi:hypothetical protein